MRVLLYIIFGYLSLTACSSDSDKITTLPADTPTADTSNVDITPIVVKCNCTIKYRPYKESELPPGYRSEINVTLQGEGETFEQAKETVRTLCQNHFPYHPKKPGLVSSGDFDLLNCQ